jgi:oligosaccharide repeat unit polymerase
VSGASLSSTVGPPAALRRATARRATFSFPAILLFGGASISLLFLAWFVPSPRLFGPATSGALAFGLFALHLLMTRRQLAAFDPGIWICVNMLFNYFGMVIAMEVLDAPGLNYDPFNLGRPPQLQRAFAVALLTMTAFLFGMHLAGWMKAAADPQDWPPAARSISRAAWAMFVLGIAMIAVGIPIAGSSVLFGAYNDMKLAQKFATSDIRFFSTGHIILQCGIFALIASHRKDRPWALRAALTAAALLAILKVMIGDRAGLMILALGAGWAFTQHVRRVPHWITVPGYIVAFLVMPIIGEFRENRRVEETVQLGTVELAASTFTNMGSSLIPFAYTLEHVPRNKPYTYGVSMLSQLVDNIPNIGLAPGRIFGLDPLTHNPSKWLVATSNPSKWRNNAGGYGFAVGAEWYFNFGMPGVFVGMTLLGLLMGRVRNASRDGPLALVFGSLVFVMVVSWVRNDFGYPFRLFMWPMLTLLILRFLTSGSGRRPTPARRPA